MSAEEEPGNLETLAAGEFSLLSLFYPFSLCRRVWQRIDRCRCHHMSRNSWAAAACSASGNGPNMNYYAAEPGPLRLKIKIGPVLFDNEQ